MGVLVFGPRVSLSCFVSSLLVASTRCLSISAFRGRFRLRYVSAVVCLHVCPGPYFEVELVFIFFLPFVNAPGEIHREEMVFGPMALRESASRCCVGHEALPLCPSSFPLFEVSVSFNVSFKVLGSTSRGDSSREEPSE